MIKSTKALSIAELKDLVSELPESEKTKNAEAYAKKFTKLSEKEAQKIREELEASDIVKINSHYVTKIIDVLPKDPEDVRKIFMDTSLSENEITKILEIVKKH